MLGFVNIQQTRPFKTLTTVSVVGIPPTVLVGVRGVNFKNMSEFGLGFGYPVAPLTIVASALLPLLWFKLRGWYD